PRRGARRRPLSAMDGRSQAMLGSRSDHSLREGAMHEPQALVSTEQLAAALGRADLRVYDCTTHLTPAPPGSDAPYVAVPGLAGFEESHVPGAGFLDLQGGFSDDGTPLRFMMPAIRELETAFARHGIGEGTRVVLYSVGTMMWATRFWWMLKSLG